MDTKNAKTSREVAVQHLLDGKDPGPDFPDLRTKFNQVQAKKKQGTSIYGRLKRALGLKYKK